MVSSRAPVRQAARKPTSSAPTTPLSLQSASPQEAFLPSLLDCRRQETARLPTMTIATRMATAQVQPEGMTIWKRMGSI
jgi:hypothetical protein